MQVRQSRILREISWPNRVIFKASEMPLTLKPNLYFDTLTALLRYSLRHLNILRAVKDAASVLGVLSEC